MSDPVVNPAVTLEEIAASTGLSVGSASRALRGLPGVSASTRAKVQRAADELGYVRPVSAADRADARQIKKTRTRSTVPGRPTMVGIADVAALAGVSQATVSRALHGSPDVASRTRQAVEEAALSLGYVGSPIAAALARGRTHTIGVLGTWVTRWFFNAAIEGVREAVAEHGYDILVYPVGVHPEPALVTKISSLSKRVDGVLRINVPSKLRAKSADDGQIPLATLGSPLDGVSGVRIDDVHVGYLATRHLLDLGHRRIAFFGLDPAYKFGFQEAADRYRGYSRALAEEGLVIEAALVKTTGFAVQGGEIALRELVAVAAHNKEALPTAVVAVSDEVAMGVLYAARQAGIDIPGDLSVIGVDDHDLAYLFDLTTVGQPIREQGRAAGTMLLAQLVETQRQQPNVVNFAPVLVRRRTTASPRRI